MYKVRNWGIVYYKTIQIYIYKHTNTKILLNTMTPYKYIAYLNAIHFKSAIKPYFISLKISIARISLKKAI